MNIEEKYSIVNKLFNIFLGLVLLSCFLMFLFAFVLDIILGALLCFPIMFLSFIIFIIFGIWNSSLKEKMGEAKRGEG